MRPSRSASASSRGRSGPLPHDVEPQVGPLRRAARRRRRSTRSTRLCGTSRPSTTTRSGSFASARPSALGGGTRRRWRGCRPGRVQPSWSRISSARRLRDRDGRAAGGRRSGITTRSSVRPSQASGRREVGAELLLVDVVEHQHHRGVAADEQRREGRDAALGVDHDVEPAPTLQQPQRGVGVERERAAARAGSRCRRGSRRRAGRARGGQELDLGAGRAQRPGELPGVALGAAGQRVPGVAPVDDDGPAAGQWGAACARSSQASTAQRRTAATGGRPGAAGAPATRAGRSRRACQAISGQLGEGRRRRGGAGRTSTRVRRSRSPGTRRSGRRAAWARASTSTSNEKPVVREVREDPAAEVAAHQLEAALGVDDAGHDPRGAGAVGAGARARGPSCAGRR